MNEAIISPETQIPALKLDAGLAALALIANYYRIAADAEQLRHELALTGRLAGAEDLIRASNLLQMKARIVRGVDARRIGAIPYPAIIELKGGEFSVLAAAGEKGRVRLVDPLARAAREISLEEVEALSSGVVILVTRRLGGAGIDPNTFGFRWFWPSIVRYRRPLAHVLVASLFVQLFALATPIFFQLVVDKVLVHKGLSTLVVLVVGMVTLGLVRNCSAVPAHLHAQSHHQPHRRRARPAALPSPLPPAARLFRDPRRRSDGRARARARNDPQLSHRPGPDRAARPRVHPRLHRGDADLFGQAHDGRADLDPGLRPHRRPATSAPARADQRAVQPRRALAAVPGRIDRRGADAEGGKRRADDAGAMGGAARLLRQQVVRRRRHRRARPEHDPVRQQDHDGADPVHRRAIGDRRLDDGRRADRLQHDRQPGRAADPQAVAALAGFPAGAGVGGAARRHSQRAARARAAEPPDPAAAARRDRTAQRDDALSARRARRPAQRDAVDRCRAK